MSASAQRSPLAEIATPAQTGVASEPVTARSLTLPGLLFITDVVAVLAASLLPGVSLVSGLVFVVTLCCFLSNVGLYRSRLSLSLLDDLPKLTMSWLAAAAVTLALNAWQGSSAQIAVGFAAVAALLLLLARFSCYWLARHLRANGTVSHRSLIIGNTETGRRLGRILRDHPEYGLRPVGFLETARIPRNDQPFPVLGSPLQLAEVIARSHINVAILAYEDVPDTDLVPLIRSCHRLRCELFLIPRFSELHSINPDTEIVWGVPIVRLRRAAHRTLSWRFKRIVDVVVASIALLLLTPLMAALGLAVRLEGGPGILFRQTRVGIDGREFSLMKFRSLRPASEAESQTNWNISLDSRLGPVGKFLRRSSLDELPQLVNIVRGDMSLVGPRPERPYFVEQFSSLYPSYGSRDRVPSGLTGWAQVHGLRGDTPVDQRADFDNFYIENWSLWLDVKIMLKTVSSVFRAQGS